MKKYKKPLLLGLTAFGLISLASCDIVGKDNFIIEYSYTSEDGVVRTKQITADDIYEKYLKSSPKDHAKAYYDAIQEIVVRVSFEDENGKMHKYLDEVKKEADKALAQEKDTADDNDEDWEDHLDSLGYDDPNWSESKKEHQFWLDKELEEMQEKVEDEYYDTFKVWDSSLEENQTDEQKTYNLVFGEDGYINTRIPYLVKHILVKCGDTSDNFIDSSIDESSATKLVRVIKALTNIGTNNTTFNSIAKLESDDTGIESNPDGYLMDTSTSFVNEFKLGVYTYDTLIGPTTNSAYTNYQTRNNKESFNIPGYESSGTHESDSDAEFLSNLGATFIPYGAVLELDELKSTTTTLDGKTVNEGNTAYYPRNIIFNKYFNRHNVAFITPDDVDSTYSTTEVKRKVNYTDGTSFNSDLDEDGNYTVGSELTSASVNLTNFHEFTFADGTTKKVLCDENGNPIMLVLNATSSGGIHFIVVDRSGLVESQKEYTSSSTARDVSLAEFYAPVNPLTQNGFNYVTEQKYYNTEFPGVEEYKDDKGTTKLTEPKQTYVYTNQAKDYDGYASLVSELKEKYQGYNSTIKDFLVSDWLQLDSTKITATNETVATLIENYEAQVKISYEKSNADTLKSAWDSYTQTIKKQEEQRKTGLIMETCALHFGEEDYYGQGKLCYYSASMDQ